MPVPAAPRKARWPWLVLGVLLAPVTALAIIAGVKAWIAIASLALALVVNGGFAHLEATYRASFRRSSAMRGTTVRALALLIQVLGVLCAVLAAFFVNLAALP